MPIYEYSCKDHGTFDKFGKITDDSAKVANCPECDTECDRIISKTGIIKGSLGEPEVYRGPRRRSERLMI